MPPDPKLNSLLRSVRECLILLLNAVDDYLGMERTVLSREERRRVAAFGTRKNT